MTKLILSVFSLCLFSACSSGTTYDQSSNYEGTSGHLFFIPENSYSTAYFTVKTDRNFYVSSHEGPDMPAHITVTSTKDKSIVTVSVARYFRSMQETCTLSAKNLVHDSASLVYGPVIENNTCIIKARENGIDMGIYLRVYNDNSFYSIHYEGDFRTVIPVIKHIEGDNRMVSMIKSIKNKV